MGLFEQFKRLILNDIAHISGFTMNQASATAAEIKATDITSLTFDGWNGATYAATTDSDDPILLLFGFAKWKKAAINVFNISRAIVGVAQTTKIKITGSGVSSGAIATVRIKLKSSNLEAEFAKYNPEYTDEKRYQITMDTTLDYVEFLKDLNALILADADLNFKSYFTATLVDNTNVLNAAAPTGILITSISPTIFFDIFIDLPAGLTVAMNTDVPASDTDSTLGGGGAANVVALHYDGRNTWEQLRHLKLETDGNIYPNSDQMAYLPVRGASYVMFYVEQNVTSDEVGASIVDQVGTVSRNRYELYIQEGSCNLVINNIARWFDMSLAAGDFYTGTTPATDATKTANNTGAAAIQLAGGILI